MYDHMFYGSHLLCHVTGDKKSQNMTEASATFVTGNIGILEEKQVEMVTYKRSLHDLTFPIHSFLECLAAKPFEEIYHLFIG